MKAFLSASRWLVGILFIFSGLIKANDPLGLSYKMQEFFEVWGWTALNDFTLAFSVLMIVFEIVAGVAVLLGWKMKLFAWLLLLLIIFFTFLTGYAYLSGKVRECGCFGDCIPLRAGQSFLKDVILLLLVLIIFAFRRGIRPVLKAGTALLILTCSTVFAFALQRHVLQHLPMIDCLPYRAGNNLPQQMKVPAGAVADSTVIVFTYKKHGQEKSFSADQFPADFGDDYIFVRREDKLIRKGVAAAIHDFSLQTAAGNDTTMQLLQEPGYKLFLFVKDGYSMGRWQRVLDSIVSRSSEEKIQAFDVTNLNIVAGSAVINDFPKLIPLRADGTAIKTAARYNPTLFLLKQGTVIGKWSAPDFKEALTTVNKLH